MRLDLDDGYTLSASTEPDVKSEVTGDLLYSGLPVVSFKYRPALPEALTDYRQKIRRAATGKDEIRAVTDLLVAHLVDWDVTTKGQPAKIDAANLAIVPDPILNQIVNAVCRWAPKAEEARGNSSTPSG